MSGPSWDYIVKFIIIGEHVQMLFYLTEGDSGVGKSNLMLRFTDNRYQSAHDVTIGVEFGARILSVEDDRTNTTKNLKCQIWDTAGQESFKSITRSYYRGATGALLVYDITRPATFTSATSWLSDLRAHADPNIAIVLVGNKADLSHDRKVTTEEARQWAKENDLSVCVESSAKSGDGVEDAFQRVAEEVFRKIRDGVFDLTDKSTGIKVNQPKKSALINLGMKEPKQQGGCC